MIGFLPEIRFSEWDHFVDSHKSGTIYHLADWLNIVQRNFKVKPFILCEFDDDTILGGIPLLLHNNLIRGKRLISITSAQSCNPLVKSQNQLDEMLDYLLWYSKKEHIRFVQIRTDESFELKINKKCTEEKDYFTYILDLNTSYESLRQKYHRSCILKPLTKINSDRLRIVNTFEESCLKKFYRNYEMMRKEHGILPQPYRFFKDLVQTLSRKNMIDIFHVFFNETIISSVINLKYKDKYIYEYGATDKRFTNFHPSHLLIDYSIRTAISWGFKEFDFGRTDLSNSGLDNFKRRWGGRKSVFTYYYLWSDKIPAQKTELKSSYILHYIISHTPQKIYHTLGPVIYKKAF